MTRGLSRWGKGRFALGRVFRCSHSRRVSAGGSIVCSRREDSMPGTRTERFFRHGTLPQMRVFEAVARLGSFTRAGEETHMAQPTVSVHMKKLAETVGVPLLHVSGKRVQLTPAGEELYAAVRRIMQTFKELDEALAAMSELKPGKLRIATTTAGEF